MFPSSCTVVRGLCAIGLMLLPGQLVAQAPQSARSSVQPGARTACIRSDSARRFERAVGTDTSASRLRGGTARSRQFPEYDVVLDVPNLCVDRITLRVDSLTAQLQLNAQIANLVRVEAGANVMVGNVDVTIQGVRAEALLLVDLDNVVHVVNNTLTFIDNNPQIVSQLGSTLQNTAGAVGGLVRGLLLSTSRDALGRTVQRLVDQATGSILERTLSTAGEAVAERVVGSVLNLPVVRETTGTANTVVRQVRDAGGRLIEYTLNRATNRITGLRLP